jgi:hypothetical protein
VEGRRQGVSLESEDGLGDAGESGGGLEMADVGLDGAEEERVERGAVK